MVYIGSIISPKKNNKNQKSKLTIKIPLKINLLILAQILHI